MAQNASTIPPKGFGKLHINDFWKSLLYSAITNMLLFLYPIINAGNWPTTLDFQNMSKTTAAMIIAYLLKNLGTNNVGEFLKKDKPVMLVNADNLNELQEKADNN